MLKTPQPLASQLTATPCITIATTLNEEDERLFKESYFEESYMYIQVHAHLQVYATCI